MEMLMDPGGHAGLPAPDTDTRFRQATNAPGSIGFSMSSRMSPC